MINSLPIHNNFGSVTTSNLSDTHICLDIKHHVCNAKVSLFGGHVLSWQPAGEKEVFWLSDNANYDLNSAIRGGIPLCWPWFGPHEKNGIKGNHGFARNLNWQLAGIDIREDSVIITLGLSGENQHPLWPEKYSIQQELSFGKTFKQTLSVTNLSGHSVEYTGALHSYFAVGAPESCSVQTLEQAKFEDKLTGNSNEPSPLESCKGPIDRIYHSNDVAIIEDKKWQRSIEVTPLNTKQWVLWNPGKDTASKMADIHSGGENEYVCLEAANTQWSEIKAGETITIGQMIKLI